MERRKFLSLTVGALVLAVAPASVRAADYRKMKPLVWTAHTVDDAIKALYGTAATKAEGVKLKAPKVAANGGAIPVDFSTKIPAGKYKNHITAIEECSHLLISLK